MNNTTYAQQVIENTKERNMDFQDSVQYIKDKIKHIEFQMEMNPLAAHLEAIIELKNYIRTAA